MNVFVLEIIIPMLNGPQKDFHTTRTWRKSKIPCMNHQPQTTNYDFAEENSFSSLDISSISIYVGACSVQQGI